MRFCTLTASLSSCFTRLQSLITLPGKEVMFVFMRISSVSADFLGLDGDGSPIKY